MGGAGDRSGRWHFNRSKQTGHRIKRPSWLLLVVICRPQQEQWNVIKTPFLLIRVLPPWIPGSVCKARAALSKANIAAATSR